MIRWELGEIDNEHDTDQFGYHAHYEEDARDGGRCYGARGNELDLDADDDPSLVMV
jgi:hypothetical protein